jgi:enoyl-CoA hydratase
MNAEMIPVPGVGCEALTVARTQHVALITMRRPERRNAVDDRIARGLEQAMDFVESDAELRVAVVAGEGTVFSAGADLSLISSGRRHEMYTERGGFAGITARERRKPLVAAVDGPALAGGFELVLACDIVVASTRATFGLPEVKRSLVAAGGGVFRTPRVLPRGIAMALLLTGEPLDAERAHALGLVAELCEPGSATEAALKMATRIAANAPLAVQLTRSLVLEAEGADEAALWKRSRSAMEDILQTEDAREGPRAFLERREPRWRGR